MTRARLSRLGLTAFDVLMIAGIALVPIVAWKGIRLMEWGLLPLLLAPLVWRRIVPDRIDWWAIGLFAQYGVLVSLNALLYPRLTPDEAATDQLALYLGSTVLLLLLVLRLRMTWDVSRLWRVVGPAAVVASVGMLGWDHFTTPPPDNCRVAFLAKFVLFPPFWMTVLAVASYAGWDRMAGWERGVRHLALGLVIVATAAFSGARAGLLAQALTIPVLALLLGMGEPVRHRLQVLAVLGATAFAGLAGGLALDYRADCGFAERLVAIGLTATHLDEAGDLARERFSDLPAEESPAGDPDPGQPRNTGAHEAEAADDAAPDLDREEQLVGSVYIRPVLWADALEAIREAPLFGHGVLNESELVIGGYPHYHQQYLSWLVWGGAPMLASGLTMLFAPLVTFGVRESRDGAVLALSMTLPLAVSFLAGSYLIHTVMVMGYAMTLALTYALARESAPSEWRVPRGDAAVRSRETARG